MTTLITGGAGFVGLALAEHLMSRGEDVVMVDLSPPPAALHRAVATASAPLRVVIGSILDPKTLRLAFDGVNRVFHGAAITAGEEREQRDGERVLTTNLIGTLRVLEAARDSEVVRFVFPSSLTVYGESLYDRPELDEDFGPAKPETVYGITKYAAERLVLRLGPRFGLDVVCGRIGSAFGPWELSTDVRDTLSPFCLAADRALAREELVIASEPVRRDL